VLKDPKRFTKHQKASILSEYAKEGLSISELSCKYQVSAHAIYKWRKSFCHQMSEHIQFFAEDDVMALKSNNCK